VVNNRIANTRNTSSPTKPSSLSYPAVAREILTRAAIIEGQRDWDSDAWQRCQFQHYLRVWAGSAELSPNRGSAICESAGVSAYGLSHFEGRSGK
jgi:hypothetical protein